MRAEELMALAAAHGIDLVQAARLGTSAQQRDTIRRGRNGRSYQVLVPPPKQRANGHATRSSLRQAWSIEELGKVAAGVPRLPFLAACFAYAGDSSPYWELWAALERCAQELRLRNRWPAQVRSIHGAPAFYLERLAQLVLDEDSNQALFSAVPATDKHASLHALYLQVEERTWQRSIYERFDLVRLTFQNWIAEAMRTMQPRLDGLADDAL